MHNRLESEGQEWAPTASAATGPHSNSCMHRCACAHTNMHTYRCMRTHAHPCTCTHTNTCAHTNMHTYTCMRTHAHPCTCTHTNTCVHRCTSTHEYTCAHTYIHVHTCTRTGTHTCTCTHALSKMEYSLSGAFLHPWAPLLLAVTEGGGARLSMVMRRQGGRSWIREVDVPGTSR